MARRRGEARVAVTIQSTAGTGYRYITTKNRHNDPERLVVRKFDPVVRRHVEFKETR